MNESSPLLLIGVGGAGSAMARGVSRAFGDTMRFVMVDTDAVTGQSGANFLLLGGDRLSGHGTGGDIVSARLAAEDSADSLDPSLEGVRLAVIVTALGGGTGGGATLEILKHLASRDIPSMVFATTPFAFEGEDRQRSARGVMAMIEDAANACFFIPLDKLVADADLVEDAKRRAIDTLSTAVTMFWRLLEKPGYLRLDVERIRHLLAKAGRGRFAVISAQGPDRSTQLLDQATRAPLLAEGSGAVRAILCGILAGDDLRLSEVGTLATGIQKAFGDHADFTLATVNDEATFSSRIVAVVMLLEANGNGGTVEKPGSIMSNRRRRKNTDPLAIGPQGRGRFNNSEATIWNGEDLDVPTYLRKNISLDC